MFVNFHQNEYFQMVVRFRTYNSITNGNIHESPCCTSANTPYLPCNKLLQNAYTREYPSWLTGISIISTMLDNRSWPNKAMTYICCSSEHVMNNCPHIHNSIFWIFFSRYHFHLFSCKIKYTKNSRISYVWNTIDSDIDFATKLLVIAFQVN